MTNHKDLIALLEEHSPSKGHMLSRAAKVIRKLHGKLDDANNKVKALQAASNTNLELISELEIALNKTKQYMDHRSGCHITLMWADETTKCSCGLDEILNTTKE